jgi:hypothetical protein
MDPAFFGEFHKENLKTESHDIKKRGILAG